MITLQNPKKQIDIYIMINPSDLDMKNEYVRRAKLLVDEINKHVQFHDVHVELQNKGIHYYKSSTDQLALIQCCMDHLHTDYWFKKAVYEAIFYLKINNCDHTIIKEYTYELG